MAAALFWLIAEIPRVSMATFYDLISHESLVLIFSPLFFLPLMILFIGLARCWRTVNGEFITWNQLRESLRSAATLKNLDGGAGQSCNYEKKDRYSQVASLSPSGNDVWVSFVLRRHLCCDRNALRDGARSPSPIPFAT